MKVKYWPNLVLMVVHFNPKTMRYLTTLILISTIGLSACQKKTEKFPRELAYANAIKIGNNLTRSTNDRISWNTRVKFLSKRATQADTATGIEFAEFSFRSRAIKRSIDTLRYGLAGVDYHVPREKPIIKYPLESSEPYMRQKWLALFRAMQQYVSYLDTRSEVFDPAILKGLGQGQSPESFYEQYFKDTNKGQALMSLMHFKEKILHCEQIELEATDKKIKWR